MKVTHISEAHAKLSDWELFWEVYPRKVAKLDALKAWEQTKNVRPEIEQVLAKVMKLAQTHNDTTFIPYPATWLRRGQFFDED